MKFSKNKYNFFFFFEILIILYLIQTILCSKIEKEKEQQIVIQRPYVNSIGMVSGGPHGMIQAPLGSIKTVVSPLVEAEELPFHSRINVPVFEKRQGPPIGIINQGQEFRIPIPVEHRIGTYSVPVHQGGPMSQIIASSYGVNNNERIVNISPTHQMNEMNQINILNNNNQNVFTHGNNNNYLDSNNMIDTKHDPNQFLKGNKYIFILTF